MSDLLRQLQQSGYANPELTASLESDRKARREAFYRFRDVAETESGAWVFTYLFNMLKLWEPVETGEERVRRNVAVEILDIMGIGRPEDRLDMFIELVNRPVKPPGENE